MWPRFWRIVSPGGRTAAFSLPVRSGLNKFIDILKSEKVSFQYKSLYFLPPFPPFRPFPPFFVLFAFGSMSITLSEAAWTFSFGFFELITSKIWRDSEVSFWLINAPYFRFPPMRSFFSPSTCLSKFPSDAVETFPDFYQNSMSKSIKITKTMPLARLKLVRSSSFDSFLKPAVLRASKSFFSRWLTIRKKISALFRSWSWVQKNSSRSSCGTRSGMVIFIRLLDNLE